MYKFGTIVLVPFPFTDLTSIKVRPALIISRTSAESKDVILAFITSRIHGKKLPGRFLLLASRKYFKQTGLKVDSVIRFDKLATLNKKIVLGEIGSLHKDLTKKAKPRLQEVFGV